MRLYDINSAIMACIDPDSGELIDEAGLEALQMEREAKLEGIALVIKNLSSEAAAIREEEKALAERRKVKENKAERLKQYLSEYLNGETFETAKIKLSWWASSAVSITDPRGLLEWLELNHQDCIKYTAPDINKVELKKLLKTGAEVPGAELVSRQNLQIK